MRLPHPVFYLVPAPVVLAAFFGYRLYALVGWWCVLASWALLGVMQVATVAWLYFWHVRDQRALKLTRM
jgi:hypothetical protein